MPELAYGFFGPIGLVLMWLVVAGSLLLFSRFIWRHSAKSVADSNRRVLKSVTTATTQGVAANPALALGAEAMLTKAVAGMDAALLQAVEANRRALG